MTTTVQAPPIAHPATRVVRSAAMSGLALRFTGHNAQDLKTVCNHSPGPGFDAGFVDGTEVVLGQPVARVYDARTRSWPTVSVGDWVVVDGGGVLVLPDAWFHALFTDDCEPQPSSLEEKAARVVASLADLSQVLHQLMGPKPVAAPEPSPWFSCDGRGFTLSFDDPAQDCDPWTAQALREVPSPWIPQAA